jgi:microcompartment protein CcmK/EutM
MRLARIRGYVTSTVKHESFTGCRLLVAQPVNLADEPDGDPFVTIDELGAAIHQKVLVCSDGSYARSYLEDASSPARWWVMALVDPPGTEPAKPAAPAS